MPYQVDLLATEMSIGEYRWVCFVVYPNRDGIVLSAH